MNTQRCVRRAVAPLELAIGPLRSPVRAESDSADQRCVCELGLSQQHRSASKVDSGRGEAFPGPPST
eukprot:14994155-Alexandrium_andersonii.AAC.1